VTSNPYADARAVELTTKDFAAGPLNITSYARPGKLFTANPALIAAQIASLSPAAFQSIVDAVVRLLRGHGD
jgi:mRNA interferase MazF